MSKRKSLPRWSRQQSRLSIQSNQSQLSGVLNPDSTVDSDDEGRPLWFRDFERHSISIRPSVRFSSAQGESPVLNSDSEPDSTPIQKSWWKNLDNTPGVRASTSNISREKSNVQERSNLESSNTSSSDEVVAKKRPVLRSNKRKSHQRHVFSEILDSSQNSIRSEKIAGDTRDEEKQRTVSSSISYTDTSPENVRKPLFRTKRNTKVVRKSANVESESDGSLPNVFTNVLDASKSTGDTRHEALAPNNLGTSQEGRETTPSVSLNSAATIQIGARDRRISSDNSEDTIVTGINLERSRSPLIMSRPKKRTMFGRTKKRRTPNFDELLDNESENESVDNELLIRRDAELDRNETRKESVTSPSPSLNIDLERSRSPLIMSHPKKRTLFNKTRKRRTPNFDELLDNESKDESVNNKSLIKGDVELDRNKTRKESVASPSPSLGLRSKTLVGEDESDTEDIIKKQRVPFAHKKRKSQQEDMFAQMLESPNTSIRSEQASAHTERRSSKKRSDRAETSGAINFELEEHQSAKKLTRLSRGTNESEFENRSKSEENDRAKSSGPVIVQVEKIYSPRQLIRTADVSKRDTNRRSKNKKNDLAETSSSLNVDGEENQSVNISIRPSKVANKSGIGGQSTNAKNDRGEISGSSHDELEENQSVGTQSRRSRGFAEPRDSIQNLNSSKQPEINKDRLSTQAKNTSLGVRNKSIGEKLSVSTIEEEEINTSLGVGNKSASRKLSVSAGEEGEKNTSRGVKRKSMSRKLSVFTEEEGEKNISRGVEKKSTRRKLSVSADEEDETDTSSGVERKSMSRKLSVSADEEGEKNTLRGVARKSTSRKLSVSADKEGEKNTSRGVARKSTSRKLSVSADKEGETDRSRSVGRKSMGRKLSVLTEEEGEKNISRGVERKSTRRKLSVSADEEDETDTSSGVERKSMSRKSPVSADEESEKNTSRGVERRSMRRKLSVLPEEEGEKNISRGVERKSTRRKLSVSADEEDETDTSSGVERKSMSRKSPVSADEESEKNTSRGVERRSMRRKLSVLPEEEGEKNISRGVERKSTRRKLSVSADEEDETDTSSGVERKSMSRKSPVSADEESEKNTSRGVERRSMRRKLSVLPEEEGEKNISRGVERKSMSRKLSVSADEEGEIDRSRSIERKSMSRKLSISTDEEEEDQEEIVNIPGSAGTSSIIDQTQKTREYPTDTGSRPLDTTSADNRRSTIPSDLPNKNADKRKVPSSTKRKSIATQYLVKTLEASQVNNLNAGCDATDAIEDTEIGESQLESPPTISQSQINGLERSFLSYVPKEVGSTQQPDTSGLVEKLVEIKSTLDKKRNEQLALMKNTKITSYFKQTSTNRANVTAKDSQTVPNNAKSMKKRKKTASAPPNKAYLVNGRVYKRPKLPRPKPWVTNRLYNFLWKRLEPKYKLETRVRSEKFVLYLSEVVALVVRRNKYKNYKDELNELIEEMARLGIIKTRHNFHIFCQDFLDYDFRIKVIPMILPGSVRNIPFDPTKLHTPILNS